LSIRVRGKNGAALAPRARVRSLYELKQFIPAVIVGLLVAALLLWLTLGWLLDAITLPVG